MEVVQVLDPNQESVQVYGSCKTLASGSGCKLCDTWGQSKLVWLLPAKCTCVLRLILAVQVCVSE